MILPAVVELETEVNKPGTNPDADTNVSTEPSMVVPTNVPTVPTYNPLAGNVKTKLPEIFSPPENCRLTSKFLMFSIFMINFIYIVITTIYFFILNGLLTKLRLHCLSVDS